MQPSIKKEIVFISYYLISSMIEELSLVLYMNVFSYYFN